MIKFDNRPKDFSSFLLGFVVGMSLFGEKYILAFILMVVIILLRKPIDDYGLKLRSYIFNERG